MRKALRRRLDYFELLAVAAILLGAAVIAGVFYTYDVSRQSALDEARIQSYQEAFWFSGRLSDPYPFRPEALSTSVEAVVMSVWFECRLQTKSPITRVGDLVWLFLFLANSVIIPQF
jgi:hypothetical protein